MKFFVASPFEEFEIDKKVMEMKAPSEDDGEEEGEASAPVEAAEVVELSNNDWTIFSRFIDRTLFLVLIAAFLIMEFSVWSLLSRGGYQALDYFSLNKISLVSVKKSQA